MKHGSFTKSDRYNHQTEQQSRDKHIISSDQNEGYDRMFTEKNHGKIKIREMPGVSLRSQEFADGENDLKEIGSYELKMTNG